MMSEARRPREESRYVVEFSLKIDLLGGLLHRECGSRGVA
jgi:hypothetical protein